MSSIRHHLTLAEACLVATRAHLESAFQHTIDQHYDTKWTCAIDDRLREITRSTIELHNIKTVIQLPDAAFD